MFLGGVTPSLRPVPGQPPPGSCPGLHLSTLDLPNPSLGLPRVGHVHASSPHQTGFPESRARVLDILVSLTAGVTV